MNSDITFLNDRLLSFYLLGGVVLFIALVYKEYGNTRKSVFYLRVSIGLIAIFSLLAIALRPAYPNKKNSNKAIVITGGADKTQLDSLKKIYPKITTVDYKSGDFIKPKLEGTAKVFLLGYGIEEYDLFQFENKDVVYLPSKLPPGIDKIKYSKTVFQGENVNIRAHFYKSKPGNKVYLEDFGGNKLDSAVIRDGEFKLNAVTKLTGEFVYQLTVIDSIGEQVIQEPLPVKINAPKKLRILILNNFPNFETRYLKNFLAEEGHQITLRTQLTSNRFKYEYLNTKTQVFSGITEDSLKDFDVLVLDTPGFSQLSVNEKQILESAVKKDGLGIYVQQVEDNFKEKTFVNFVTQFDGLPEMKWHNESQIELYKYPYIFQKTANTYSLLEIEDNLAVYQYLGRGKVGSSVFKNTYQLLLKGNKPVYREIWTDIFKEIAKPSWESVNWQLVTDIGLVNVPVDIRIKTALARPALTDNLEHHIALLQHADISDEYVARIYPEKEGWNHLKLSADDSILDFKFYVFKDDDWSTKRRSNLLKNSQSYFNNVAEAQEKELLLKPINVYWFYFIFIGCVSFLWLHPKLKK